MVEGPPVFVGPTSLRCSLHLAWDDVVSNVFRSHSWFGILCFCTMQGWGVLVFPLVFFFPVAGPTSPPASLVVFFGLLRGLGSGL